MIDLQCTHTTMFSPIKGTVYRQLCRQDSRQALTPHQRPHSRDQMNHFILDARPFPLQPVLRVSIPVAVGR